MGGLAQDESVLIHNPHLNICSTLTAHRKELEKPQSCIALKRVHYSNTDVAGMGGGIHSSCGVL